MSYRICFLTALMMIVVGTVGSWSQAEHLVARDGVVMMDIVVGVDATTPERYAAEELSAFLTEVTGANFVVREALRDEVPALLVGGDAARLVEPGFCIEGMAADGIVMKSVGNSLILAGGRPRGTVYAVYTFLQDEVGCRWWTSKASTIPQTATLMVGEQDLTYAPPFEYRESFWFDAFDGDWAVRNRCNGNTHRVTAEQGGKHVYQGFVHTFSRIIPPGRYFTAHPEWFSMIDGERMGTRPNGRLTQLCLTNEEMRAEFVANLRQNLRANPLATIASVSQNDVRNRCECPACLAVEEEEGGPAGPMLRFVNTVAAELEEEFSQVAFSTLAYQYTRRPPAITRPRDNVIVRLCSIECSFSVPLSDERNATFRDDIVGWSQICDRLYVWDYVTNFRHYVLPHPNVRVLGDNVRFFRDHNVVGLFEQGNYQSYGGEMAALKAWVLARLMWNPDLDDAALVREFAQGYYGPAGNAVLGYLDCIHDAVAETGNHLGCFSGHDVAFLAFEVMARGWGLLQEAEAAVADQPGYKSRVELAKFSVMYTFLRNWQAYRDAAQATGADWPMDADINQVHAEFLRIAREHEVVVLREGGPGRGFDMLAEAVQAAQ